MTLLNLITDTAYRNVPADSEPIENHLLVRLEPARSADFGVTSFDVALALDNSGSMTEKPATGVAPVADLVRALGQLQFRPNDHMTAVAFGSLARVFHPLTNNHASFLPWTQLDYYRKNVGAGGMTNMAEGIATATRELQKCQGDRPKRLLLLTDGRPYISGTPEAKSRADAMAAARTAVAAGIPITAVGFGEYDADFMNEIAALSNGTVWHIQSGAQNIEVYLPDLVRRIQEQVVENVTLEIEFLGNHQIDEWAVVHPTVTLNGKVKLPTDRTLRHPIEPIRRSEGLEILFSMVNAKLTRGTKTIARVVVHFDVPSRNLRGQTLQKDVTVEYTPPGVPMAAVEPTVKLRADEMFFAQQAVRLQQALKADDVKEALNAAGTLKKSGDPQLRSLAEGTRKKLDAGGQVSAEELRTLESGTKKKLITRS